MVQEGTAAHQAETPAFDEDWRTEAEGVGLRGHCHKAILLFVGFYVGSILGAAALFFVTYFYVVSADSIGYLPFVSAFLGCSVIWTMIPRWDRFKPPGTELKAEDQPELFGFLRETADEVGEKMPAHVYLVPDTNAWVTNRGGLMGLGSKRIMGLGLPMLQGMTRAEMKSVIAHEFGHFTRDRSALGAFMYRMRETIGRALQKAEESAFLAIYAWFWERFMLVTQKISRIQEYGADAVAARVVGSNAMISGFRKVNGINTAFDAFWNDEIHPVLRAGYRPDMSAGFTAYLQSPFIVAYMQEEADRAHFTTPAHPFDSHPSMANRILAVKDYPEKPLPEDNAPLISLLRNRDALEDAIYEEWLGFPPANLDTIDWQEVAVKVWVPYWRRKYKPLKEDFDGFRLEDVYKHVRHPGHLMATLDFDPKTPPEAKRGLILFGFFHALALALHNCGWSVTTLPGHGFIFEKGDQRLDLRQVMDDINRGECSEEEWSALIVSEAGQATLGELMDSAADGDG